MTNSIGRFLSDESGAASFDSYVVIGGSIWMLMVIVSDVSAATLDLTDKIGDEIRYSEIINQILDSHGPESERSGGTDSDSGDTGSGDTGTGDNDDGNNGHGNDPGGFDPSNPGNSGGSGGNSGDGNNGHGNDPGGFDPSNPGNSGGSGGNSGHSGHSSGKNK